MVTNKRKVLRDLSITIMDNDHQHVIHKEKIVTYHGFRLDYLMRPNVYVLAQLEKTK